MIYVLDTDILSLLAHDSPEAPHIRRRIVELPPSDSVVTTIINYEEQMRGWMALLGRAKSSNAEVAAYSRLLAHLITFKRLTVLGYPDAAAKWFEQLKRQWLKIGAMDLRIASIVLASDGLLATRNKRDFEKIPGLRIADWSNPNDTSL